MALWRLRRRGDLVARLEAAATMPDPYRLYESVRERGAFYQSPLGITITASHAVSAKLLRSPALGHQGGPSQRQLQPPHGGELVHPIHDAFIVMDPPEHTRLRRLVAPGFTPRALERLRPRIERITGELLDQLDRLRASPALAANLVEETLRFDPPVQRTGRTVQREVEAAGTVLRPGEVVVMVLGGANRDPEVFERPHEFDIGRPNAREHLAFAAGIHYCLGAGLARLEGEVAFRALADRLPDLEPGGSVQRRPSQIIRGALHLPLRRRAWIGAAPAPRRVGHGR